MKSKNSFIGLCMLILVLLLCSSVSLCSDVRLVSEMGSHTEAWKTCMKSFEENTEYELEITQFPYANYRDQLMLNFTSGKANFDVPYISLLWYPSFAQSNYIQPLNEIIDRNPELKDDMPGLSVAYKDNKLYFVPYMNELGGVIYRKDLFDNPEEKTSFKKKYGYELVPPKTIDQYKDIAEFFNRPPELYGVTLMGKRSIFLATHFMNRLWAGGGRLLDDDMKPVFDNEIGVEALKEVKEMFKYANPAAYTYDFQDALTEFTLGKSAMAELWTTALFYADNKEKSKIVGKASFIGFPRTKENLGKKCPMLYISWGFSIAKDAQNKEAALKWIEHVISKDQYVSASLKGTIPTRLSVLDDPQLTSHFDWVKSFKEALGDCIPTPISPLIPEGSVIVDQYIALAVSEYITGNISAEEVLSTAAKSVYQLLEENNYYK